MPSIGVLGGMGPAATVDFMAKLVALTPAHCDQDHLPVVVANLPQVPDRSAAILGQGPDPLPLLRRGIELLNRSEVGVVVIPCNSSHHWHGELSRLSSAPILHIAQCCVARVPAGARTLLLATRGAIASGFYQRALDARRIPWELPADEAQQRQVDDCIRSIKAGDRRHGGRALGQVFKEARRRGVQAVIMGCTEIPIAAEHADGAGLVLLDSSLELARAAVEHALQRGWNHA